ncbi:DEAD/DEAH box helicase [Bacillaceae bacterium S4-13-56]
MKLIKPHSNPTPSITFSRITQPSPYTSQLAGRLLLRKEIQLPEDIFQQLLQHHYLIEKPPILKTIGGYQCQRCGANKKHQFGLMPCLNCGKPCLYCRKCVVMGRVQSCTPLYEWNGPDISFSIPEKPLSWEGSLTKAQEHASQKIEQAMYDKSRLLVHAVCGAGKTEMLFAGISNAFQRGERIAIATPRSDVVRELAPRLRQAFSQISIAALYGGTEDIPDGAQLIITTTHQLFRFSQAFDVMVIDEVDAFPFHGDPSLPFATKRATKLNGATIYLTATPRSDLKHQVQQRKLDVVFVPVRFHGHPLPVPKFQLIYNFSNILQKNQLPKAIVQWIKQKRTTNRRLLLFVSEIEMAHMAKEILIHKFPHETIENVHAADPDREQKILLYRQQKISILITTTILERGVTFPSIDVAVIDAGHEVFDEAALVQIAGRAGRSADDPTGEVIFFHNGLTIAMKSAKKSIHEMNKKGEKIKHDPLPMV